MLPSHTKGARIRRDRLWCFPAASPRPLVMSRSGRRVRRSPRYCCDRMRDRSPATRPVLLRTTSDTDDERRDDTLAFSREGQPSRTGACKSPANPDRPFGRDPTAPVVRRSLLDSHGDAEESSVSVVVSRISTGRWDTGRVAFRWRCGRRARRLASPCSRAVSASAGLQDQAVAFPAPSRLTRSSASSRLPVRCSRNVGGCGGSASAESCPWWMSASAAKKRWSRPA